MEHPQFILSNNSITTWIPILCNHFQTTDDKKWQIETFYKYPIEIGSGVNKISSILLKLAKENYFDLRDFLSHFIKRYPNEIVKCNISFYLIFNQVVLYEIGERKDIILIPKPVNKGWKSNSIILPSLVNLDIYYWLPYTSNPRHVTYDPISASSFPLSILINGDKDKII